MSRARQGPSERQGDTVLIVAVLVVVSVALAGCADSSEDDDDLDMEHPIPPQAHVESFCSTLHCIFDGGRSGPGETGGDIDRYAWDMGDGNSAEGPHVDWTYEEPGSYAVVLTVYTDHAGMATATEHVQVSHPAPRWREDARIVAPPDSEAWNFGTFVALAGDTALVGDNGIGAEAAFVFTRGDDGWREQARLPNHGAGDQYPAALALDGDTAFVASLSEAFAPGGGGGFSSGDVSVFVRNGTEWTHESTLTRPYDAKGSYSDFGARLVLDGDLALVADASQGSAGQGEVFVYAREDGQWVFEAVLAPEARSATFGLDVALSGETAWIVDQGQAFVYTRSGGAWTSEGRFAIHADASHGASSRVALDGATAAVVSPGNVTLYMREGGNWSEDARLQRPAGESTEDSAQRVALDGDKLLVSVAGEGGSDGVSDGPDVHILVYVRDADRWILEDRLPLPEADRWVPLDLDGDMAIAGVPKAGEDGEVSVYVREPDGPASQVPDTGGEDVAVGPSSDVNGGSEPAVDSKGPAPTWRAGGGP